MLGGAVEIADRGRPAPWAREESARRIVATTPVQDVLGAYPDAADVLDWYGVDPEELAGQTLTVRELCKTFDVELEEMLTDLQALADEDEEGDDDEDDEDDEDDDEDDDAVEDDDERRRRRRRGRGRGRRRRLTIAIRRLRHAPAPAPET